MSKRARSFARVFRTIAFFKIHIFVRVPVSLVLLVAQRHYFVNLLTQESQWDAPEAHAYGGD
jgi:hypothetical protein